MKILLDKNSLMYAYISTINSISGKLLIKKLSTQSILIHTKQHSYGKKMKVVKKKWCLSQILARKNIKFKSPPEHNNFDSKILIISKVNNTSGINIL